MKVEHVPSHRPAEEPVKKPVVYRLRATGSTKILGKAVPEARSLEPEA
jgi:hypothetical protein